jgi:hypothetical protein
MSLTKQIYDREKLYNISDIEYYEKLLYVEGFDKPKKGSLNYGDVLDLTSGKKNRRKRVVVER